MTSREQRARNVRRELRRHSTFVDDGQALFETLGAQPAVAKVEMLRLAGRTSGERCLCITRRSGQLVVTIKNSSGRQQFRVFAPEDVAKELAAKPEGRFSNYHITVNNTPGGEA